MTESPREVSLRLLDRLIAELGERPEITPGRMPTGTGYRYGDRFLAIIDREGDLSVKLPEQVVAGLIALRKARPQVVANTVVAREWARIPYTDDFEPTAWREALAAAIGFAEKAAAESAERQHPAEA